MAVRKDDRPYLALGQLLESWRRTKFRSALALFKATKFSFSYAAYADFERGVTLPSIDAIVELAHFLKQEPSQAALLWARLQMPTKQLQELVLFERRKRARDVPAPATEEKSPAPSFENTWVFGPRERALLLKHPWFWDVCMVLNSAFPNAVPVEVLPFPSDVSDAEFVSNELDSWLRDGYLRLSDAGLAVTFRHLHIPKTAEWTEVRNNNSRRAVESLLAVTTPEHQASGSCYRELVYRPLSQAQVRTWVTNLKKVEADFKAEPYVAEESTYSLFMVLGPRRLRK